MLDCLLDAIVHSSSPLSASCLFFESVVHCLFWFTSCNHVLRSITSLDEPWSFSSLHQSNQSMRMMIHNWNNDYQNQLFQVTAWNRLKWKYSHFLNEWIRAAKLSIHPSSPAWAGDTIICWNERRVAFSLQITPVRLQAIPNRHCSWEYCKGYGIWHVNSISVSTKH